jgi:hypothetical protein
LTNGKHYIPEAPKVKNPSPAIFDGKTWVKKLRVKPATLACLFACLLRIHLLSSTWKENLLQ